MDHSIEVRRHRIDELAHELLTNEFVVDKADLEELVRVSREVDDWRAKRINFLESEVDSLRLENKKMYAANETRIERIKLLKDERGILRRQVHQLEGVLESNDI
jgi:ABC-type phosphate transport system auxiliary subunit